MATDNVLYQAEERFRANDMWARESMSAFTPMDPTSMFGDTGRSDIYANRVAMESAAARNTFMGFYQPYAQQALNVAERQAIISGAAYGITSGGLMAAGVHPILAGLAGMAVQALAPEISQALGIAEQNPYIDVDTLTASMMTESIHQTAWNILGPGITGGFRGTSIQNAKEASVYMMDQMRNMGMQGAELVNIMPSLQQSGLLDDSQNFEEMINKATDIISKISDFIKSTGATISEAVQYAALGGALGASVDRTFDIMSSTTNVSMATGTPVADLIQRASALAQPFSMGAGDKSGILEGYMSLAAMSGATMDRNVAYSSEMNAAGGAAGMASIVAQYGMEGMTRRRAARFYAAGPDAMADYMDDGKIPESLGDTWGGLSANERYEAYYNVDEFIAENYENLARGRRSHYDRIWEEADLTSNEARAGWLMQNRGMSGSEAISYVLMDPNDVGIRWDAMINTYTGSVEARFNSQQAGLRTLLNEAGAIDIARRSSRFNSSEDVMGTLNEGGNISSEALTRLDIDISTAFEDSKYVDWSTLQTRRFTREQVELLKASVEGMDLGYTITPDQREDGTWSFEIGGDDILKIPSIFGSGEFTYTNIEGTSLLASLNATTAATISDYQALSINAPSNANIDRTLEYLQSNPALAQELASAFYGAGPKISGLTGYQMNEYQISSNIPSEVPYNDPVVGRYGGILDVGSINEGLESGTIKTYTQLTNEISRSIFDGRLYSSLDTEEARSVRSLSSVYFGDADLGGERDAGAMLESIEAAQANLANYDSSSPEMIALQRIYGEYGAAERTELLTQLESTGFTDIHEATRFNVLMGGIPDAETRLAGARLADTASFLFAGSDYLAEGVGVSQRNRQEFFGHLMEGDLAAARSLATVTSGSQWDMLQQEDALQQALDAVGQQILAQQEKEAENAPASNLFEVGQEIAEEVRNASADETKMLRGMDERLVSLIAAVKSLGSGLNPGSGGNSGGGTGSGQTPAGFSGLWDLLKDAWG